MKGREPGCLLSRFRASEDIVRRFRQVNAKLHIGTYSGRGGQYTQPFRRELANGINKPLPEAFFKPSALRVVRSFSG